MDWSSSHHLLRRARAFSTNPRFPFNNSRHVILVLRYVQLCLKIPGYIVDKLEKCKHTSMGLWHNALDEGRFARGEAIAAELPAAGKRRLHWFTVDEVGPGTLANWHR